MRSVLGLLVLLCGVMASSGVRAALMEIRFSGEIFAVENTLGDYWEGGADALIGVPVQGRYLLDATAAGEGRQETSFFWWWDIDYRAGVMTSEISFGERQFKLTGNHDCFDIEGGTACEAGEFITLYTDESDEDGEEAPDSLSLKDRERVTVVVESEGGVSTYAESTEILEIHFADAINEILGPPPLDQEFHWIDAGTGQGGGGYLNLRGWDVAGPDPFTELWNTRVGFRLDEVISRQASGTDPIDVPEPGSLGLMLLGLLTGIWLRHRPREVD